MADMYHISNNGMKNPLEYRANLSAELKQDRHFIVKCCNALEDIISQP